MSVLEEGYLIEEGGLPKFQKCYKRGSDKRKTLQDGGLDRRGGCNTHHRFIIVVVGYTGV